MSATADDRVHVKLDLSVDVPRCPIATDAINTRLATVRATIHARAAAGEFERGSTIAK